MTTHETTHKRKLLRTSIGLALALFVLAPVASFAGSWGVGVGIGVAPSPVYVGGYYYPYPAYYPYGGSVWVAPHWGWYGYHRIWVRGYWRHRGYYHHGYYRRW